MDELKVIIIMNEAMLETLKERNENYEENEKIKEKLKDEAYFFKIDKAEAYEILQNVGVKSKSLEEVYKKLTAPAVFYDLLYKGKIKADDENLIIKYDTYKSKKLK